MTQLYPRFIDPYYFCQGFLPHISPEAAPRPTLFLKPELQPIPNDLILRFFHGTNFFLSMNEPLKGAKAFAEAAKLPEPRLCLAILPRYSPPRWRYCRWTDLARKPCWLQKKMKRFAPATKKKSVIFEQALEVQKGLNNYISKHGVAPKTLEQLVPDFIRDCRR